MAIKHAGHDGEPRAYKRLWRSKWNMIYDQEDFDPAIHYNENGGGFVEELEESLELKG